MTSGEEKLSVLEKVIGMTEKDAVSAIKAAGMLVRVKYHDQPYRGDCARVANRITITIRDGKVSISSLG